VSAVNVSAPRTAPPKFAATTAAADHAERAHSKTVSAALRGHPACVLPIAQARTVEAMGAADSVANATQANSAIQSKPASVRRNAQAETADQTDAVDLAVVAMERKRFARGTERASVSRIALVVHVARTDAAAHADRVLPLSVAPLVSALA
jgi:hypothetical protein